MKNILGIMAVLAFCFVSCYIDDSRYNVFDDDNAIANNRDKFFVRESVIKNFTNNYSQRVSSLTGLKTIKTIDGDQKFDVNLTISSGRFKLVLVDENNVIIICDGNTNRTIEFPELDGKKCKIKIVGDKAAFDLKVTF
jgi:hypothetical protein